MKSRRAARVASRSSGKPSRQELAGFQQTHKLCETGEDVFELGLKGRKVLKECRGLLVTGLVELVG